jgi:hypothetical protein
MLIGHDECTCISLAAADSQSHGSNTHFLQLLVPVTCSYPTKGHHT